MVLHKWKTAENPVYIFEVVHSRNYAFGEAYLLTCLLAFLLLFSQILLKFIKGAQMKSKIS